MPTPDNPRRYFEKDRVDNAIDAFAGATDAGPQGLQAVRAVARIESQLDAYRADAESMTARALRDEAHVSARLGEHLALAGDPRPSEHCHAHAIVAGRHRDAAVLRAVLARLKVRIDDPDNGCWLPRNTAAVAQMPPRLRKAVPHSRIHRANYFTWLDGRIDLQKTPTAERLRLELEIVERQLQQSTFPPYVMMRKGEGLPG